MSEANEQEVLISARNLVKTYHGRRVVSDVSITVKAGEVVGLLGPNGAGKTTSFYMVMGLIRPDSGEITFRDVDITHMPMYKRARMGMGYLAQEPSIFRKLTVEENIMAILETLAISAAERRQRCKELLDELDAPVERVCGLNIVSPFSPVLEDKNFPHPDDIYNAVKRVLNK